VGRGGGELRPTVDSALTRRSTSTSGRGSAGAGAGSNRRRHPPSWWSRRWVRGGFTTTSCLPRARPLLHASVSLRPLHCRLPSVPPAIRGPRRRRRALPPVVGASTAAAGAGVLPAGHRPPCRSALVVGRAQTMCSAGPPGIKEAPVSPWI
jgi:hypothetical protein